MKQESKRLSGMIIAALLLVAAVVVYFDLLQPAYSDLQTEKGRQISEQNLLTNEKQTISQVQALISTYQTATAAQQSVNLALPVGQDIAGALAQVYGLATNSGMVVHGTGVTIQAVSDQGQGTAGQVGQDTSSATVIKPTGTVSFQITASGSYEALKTFLQGLEGNIRVFDISTISVHPLQVINTKGANVTQDIYTFGIMAVTYYQAP